MKDGDGETALGTTLGACTSTGTKVVTDNNAKLAKDVADDEGLGELRSHIPTARGAAASSGCGTVLTDGSSGAAAHGTLLVVLPGQAAASLEAGEGEFVANIEEVRLGSGGSGGGRRREVTAGRVVAAAARIVGARVGEGARGSDGHGKGDKGSKLH